MGMRPPSDDNEEPDSIEFGIAAVDARLKKSDLSFPASQDDVATALGSERVPYDIHGNTVPLKDVLEETRMDEFETRQELLNALHPHFEDYRTRHSASVVQQVRSLLPF